MKRITRSLSLAILGLLATVANADILVSAGADKKVKIWNPADGKLIREIAAHDGAITQVYVSDDGKTLITSGADKKVKLWNAEDGKLIKEIIAHDGVVTAFSGTPDGKSLITSGDDKKVKIWDLATGKLTSTIDAEEKVVAALPAPGMTIAGGAEMIRIFDESGNTVISLPTEHTGGLTAMGGAPGAQVIISGGSDGSLRHWQQGNIGDFDKKAGGAITVIAFLPGGKTLLTGSKDGKVNIWDAEAYTLTKTIDGVHPGGVNAIAVSGDGKTIFTGGEDKTVKLWSPDGKLVKTVEKAHDGAVTYLFYHADKKADSRTEAKSAEPKKE